MALIKNENNRKTFLEIKDYSICQVSSQEVSGWEKITTTDRDGKQYTKYVNRFRTVDGHITGIEYIKRTLPGTNTELASWKISLHDRDADERYVLTFPATSPASSRFLKLAENINPDQAVEFAAWKDTQDAKPKLAFMVKQDGKNVPQKYSIKEIEIGDKKVVALVNAEDPENPDAPKLHVRRNGDKDWSEIEDFLFERMESVVAPRFANNDVAPAAEPHYLTDIGNDSESTDEIPF